MFKWTRDCNTLPGDNLGGCDAVDEADLLEALLAHGETHLPSWVHHLVHYSERRPRLICSVLHIQVHIAAEAVHLNQTINIESQ